MAKHVLGRLTEAQVRSAPAGKHCDGGGLWLEVKATGKRRWFLRYQYGTLRREAGIGPYPEVTREAARAEAGRLRALLSEGIDPLAPLPEPEVAPPVRTFTTAAAQFIRQHRRAWSNPKHARQWTSTLKTYARPVIGALPVDQIQTQHILTILQPLWLTRTETAKRLQGRIERVLDQETALKHRSGDNPARWRGHLQALLPPPNMVKRVRHQPALPWEEVPAFMQELRQYPGVPAAALEWLIRTATRTGETLGARWREIDRQAGTWTIPAERMKGRRQHQVPLTPEMVVILDRLPRLAGSDWLFPSVQVGKHIGSRSLLRVMLEMGHGKGGGKSASVPHGFRSTFRDWCGETQAFAREVVEECLAHVNPNRVEAAYRRGSMLQKRLAVMTAWSQYLDRPPAQVIILHPDHPAITEARAATA
jgi:integrase